MRKNSWLLSVLATLLALTAMGGPVGGQDSTSQPAEEETEFIDVTSDDASPDGAARDQDGSPAGGAASETQPADEQPPAGPVSLTDRLFKGQGFFFVMIAGFILLYIWMGRGRKKQAAKRRQMLASLSKGDKVTSIGGIVGTIVEVREDEVTVKVDENNNIRMKFARWAIRGVGDDAKTQAPEEKR